MTSTCSIEGCENEAKKKGYCIKHYQRIRRHGDPHFTKIMIGIEQCIVEGCDKKPVGNGLCRTHYQRKYVHGDENFLKHQPRAAQCSMDGCGNKVHAKNYCKKHYNRWKTHGDAGYVDINSHKEIPLQERLFAQIEKMPNGCWEWRGGCDKKTGYGKIRINSKSNFIHRVMYELYNGEIAEGMFICHKCDNPPCCNPDHLFQGTHADNMRDKTKKGRQSKGERNGAARLTWEDVCKARELYETGNYTIRQIAEMYNYSEGTMWEVLNYKLWKEPR